MGNDEGSISVEVRDHILLIGLNRPEKYNGYTPKMSAELVSAYTRLDEDDDLRVGVLFGHGDHFTAGLDLPKWTERMERNDGSRSQESPKVDPFGFGRRLSIIARSVSSKRFAKALALTTPPTSGEMTIKSGYLCFQISPNKTGEP